MRVKIIGISGSPRKGNTNILVNVCLDSARELKDVETEFIHLADYKIDGGCKACYACFKKPDPEKLCYAYKDDLNLILKKMMTGDGFILGCPVYWGSVTSQFKTLIDRTHPFSGLGRPLRNKPVGGVTVALGKIAGQENVLFEIMKFAMFMDMIPIGTKVSWPREGMSCPWGVAGQQGWPEQWGSTNPGNLEAVNQDKAAFACAKVLGMRVAEMAKVIKAGFTLCNPENGETKWPVGRLSLEDIKDYDAHYDYRMQKQ